MRLILSYFMFVNCLGFISMGLDKFFAKKNMYRIPEVDLLLIAAIGGCIGSWLGMQAFRHKTQHWKFVWGIPLIGLLHIGLLAFYLIVIN